MSRAYLMSRSSLHFPYGSNPCDVQAVVRTVDGSQLPLTVWHGQLSYNNAQDVWRAWSISSEIQGALDATALVLVKNGRPIGAAVAPRSAKWDLAQLVTDARRTHPVPTQHECAALTTPMDAAVLRALLAHDFDAVIAPAITDSGQSLLTELPTRLRIMTVDSARFERLRDHRRSVHSHYGLLFEEDEAPIVEPGDLTRIAAIAGIPAEAIVMAVTLMRHSPHRALWAACSRYTVAAVVGAAEEDEAVDVLVQRLRENRVRAHEQRPLVAASGVDMKSRASHRKIQAAGINCFVQPGRTDGEDGQAPFVHALGRRCIRRW